jgi:hypothetical protein
VIASRWKVEVLTGAVHGLVGIILLREIDLILFRQPLWFAFCRYVIDVDVLACWFIKHGGVVVVVVSCRWRKNGALENRTRTLADGPL